MSQLEEMEEKTNIIIEKLLDEEMWLNYGVIGFKILLQILLIILISVVIIRIGRTAIDSILKIKPKTTLRFSERREATLVKLLKNILTYSVYFIAFCTILSTMSIEIRGILAGAGILGLAVGFGAQNLVKDVISGFFIIFEDQFAVGDEVKIGQFEGKVEEIGLRTTKILNWTGELYIVPNGSITSVTNFSIYNSTAIIDININYDGDLKIVEDVIEGLLNAMPNKYTEIIGRPKLLGIQQFTHSEIVFRITAETIPLKHWYIARQLRRELKMAFDAQGI